MVTDSRQCACFADVWVLILQRMRQRINHRLQYGRQRNARHGPDRKSANQRIPIGTVLVLAGSSRMSLTVKNPESAAVTSSGRALP